MKVYHTLEQFQKVENGIVTIGTFDGVHLGHQKIISSLKQIAKEKSGETVVLTLHPHARMVLYPDDTDLKLLTSIEERATVFNNLGVDHLIIHPFTKEFSKLLPAEFVETILVDKIGTKILVIGYDHHFGRNREGSFELLKELAPKYHFDLVEIPEIDVNDIAVSSTKIRKALKNGDIHIANQYLGHDFELTGIVIHGKKVGKAIGYPTANIYVQDLYKIVPCEGIYAVLVKVDSNIYKGMLYIGNRPTLEGSKQSIEVNILDFNKDIYDQKITVIFKHRIRDDQKFDSLEALTKQIDLDKLETIKLLSQTY